MSVLAAWVTGEYNESAVSETNAMNFNSQAATNRTNLAIAQQTNQANKEIADATNKANKEIAEQTNAFQREESEKAYQRSTQTNQIAELMRAGFSAQQAKQIVAGSGSPAAYPPAPMTAAQMQAAQMQTGAPMQAPHVEPALLDPSAMVGAGANLAHGISSLAQDYFAKDGGAIGNLLAQKGVKTAMRNMDKIPAESLSSPMSFLSWLDSDSAAEAFTADEIKTMRTSFNTAQGARAMMAQMNDLANSWSNTQRIRAAEESFKQQQIQTRITKIQEQISQGQFDAISMQNELTAYKVQLAPIDYQATFQELTERFNQASLNNEYMILPEYREAFIHNTLANENYRTAFLATATLNERIKSMSAEEALEYMQKHKTAFGIYQLFRDYGMTTTNVGAAVAALTAEAGEAGFDIQSWINQFVADTKKSYKPTKADYNKAAEAVVEASKGKNSLERKYESLVE